MNLNSLLKELGRSCDFGDIEITNITTQTKDVKQGSLFVAVNGRNFDGHDFVDQAFSMGAAAAIVQKKTENPKCITVSDTETAYSFLCSAFYSHPQDSLRMIGVTGTNGKTTTAEYIKYLLEKSGHKCAVLGTLGAGINDERENLSYTTPLCNALFYELSEFKKSGCEFCVMEVSSQALAQRRVEAIMFELAVLTNIGSDHLDWHGNFDRYLSDKCRLFGLSENILLNADDPYIDIIENYCPEKKISYYSAKNTASDYSANNIRAYKNSISFLTESVGSILSVKTNTPGDFSVYNALCAVASVLSLGISPGEMPEEIDFPPVKGRLQRLTYNGVDIYIDFAHNEKALKNTLSCLKPLCTGALITVFGCGGNRDSGKRPLMGKAAAEISDVIVVTSDNPRNEDPKKIINDILSGIKVNKPVFVEPDRKEGIFLALQKALPGDTVLIAGKGHENYQECRGLKTYFSDEEVVKEYYRKNI